MNTLLKRQLTASLAIEEARKKHEIGFREIRSPYDDELTIAAVNIKSDMVEYWYNRGPDKGGIDYAQFKAGRHFLFLVEKAEGAAFLVADMQREPVDCSGVRDAIPTSRLEAARELRRVAIYLRPRDYALARRFITCDVAAYPKPTSERESEYQRRRMRDVLEDLAEFWGYKN